MIFSQPLYCASKCVRISWIDGIHFSLFVLPPDGAPNPVRKVAVAASVAFPGPAMVRCCGEIWLFARAVIEGVAVGIAARRPPPELTPVIEVFACEQLAPRLGLQDGRTVEIRLLPAVHLTTVLQEACN